MDRGGLGHLGGHIVRHITRGTKDLAQTPHALGKGGDLLGLPPRGSAITTSSSCITGETPPGTPNQGGGLEEHLV
jgi:hypothetical protein